MPGNQPQGNVLVNPLPFNTVQDPTVISRAGASDAFARGAMQEQAITAPLSPRTNAEDQAAIAEANIRQRNAQDQEIQDAKKLIVVAQGAAAKAARQDLEFADANRELRQRIQKETWRNELATQALGVGPDGLHAANALLLDAGLPTPKDANGNIDAEAVKQLIPDLRRWQKYQMGALRAADSSNVENVQRVSASGAPIVVRVRKDTQAEWSPEEQKKLLQMGRLPFTTFIKQEAAGILPTVEAPLMSDIKPGAVQTAPAPKATATPEATPAVAGTSSVLAPGSVSVGQSTTLEHKPVPGSAEAFIGDGSLIVGADGTLRDPQGHPITKLPEVSTLKPPTESQAKAADYSNRMYLAERAYESLVSEGKFDPTAISTWIQTQPFYFDGLRTGRMSVFDAVVDEFANALLRRDSGAAITADERSSYRKMFFPRIGDSDTAKALKQAQRLSIQTALGREGAGQVSALTVPELNAFNQQVQQAAKLDYENGGATMLQNAINARIQQAPPPSATSQWTLQSDGSYTRVVNGVLHRATKSGDGLKVSPK